MGERRGFSRLEAMARPTYHHVGAGRTRSDYWCSFCGDGTYDCEHGTVPAPTPEAECPCEGTGYIEVGTYQRARVICEEHFVPGDPNATGPAPIPATEGRSEGDLADALMSAVNRATRDRVHLDGEEADMVLRLLGPSPSAGTPAATEGRRDDDTVRVPR